MIHLTNEVISVRAEPHTPCIDAARGIRLAGQNAALYSAFLRQFPADDTFSRLAHAFHARDAAQSLRFAHMLKGLCAQLCLTALQEAADALCLSLRAQPPDMHEAARAFEAVAHAYRETLAAIAAL